MRIAAAYQNHVRVSDPTDLVHRATKLSQARFHTWPRSSPSGIKWAEKQRGCRKFDVSPAITVTLSVTSNPV